MTYELQLQLQLSENEKMSKIMNTFVKIILFISIQYNVTMLYKRILLISIEYQLSINSTIVVLQIIVGGTSGCLRG